MSDAGDLRPRPDPTVLTTAQLLREIDNAKEQLRAECRGSFNVIEKQFQAVDQRFDQAEKWRLEQKADNTAATGAALTAAKEAVSQQNAASQQAIAKSEAATMKQISDLGARLTSVQQNLQDRLDAAVKSLEDKIARLTETVNTMEAVTQ